MSKSCCYFSSLVFLTFTSGPVGHVICSCVNHGTSQLSTSSVVRRTALSQPAAIPLSATSRPALRKLTPVSSTHFLSPRSARLLGWACWTRKLVGLPWARADLNCWSWRISRCRVDKLSCPLDCLGVNISWGDSNRITVAVFKLNNNHQHYLWWHSF